MQEQQSRVQDQYTKIIELVSPVLPLLQSFPLYVEHSRDSILERLNSCAASFSPLQKPSPRELPQNRAEALILSPSGSSTTSARVVKKRKLTDALRNSVSPVNNPFHPQTLKRTSNTPNPTDVVPALTSQLSSRHRTSAPTATFDKNWRSNAVTETPRSSKTTSVSRVHPQLSPRNSSMSQRMHTIFTPRQTSGARMQPPPSTTPSSISKINGGIGLSPAGTFQC
jgi:hypothetical protein